MMRMEADVETYYDEAIATSVLHLPFNNSYSMLLLLPDTMETLENKISPAHITRWLQRMKQRLEEALLWYLFICALRSVVNCPPFF